MPSCLLLVAGFCLSGSAVHVDMNDFHMGYNVEIGGPGYKARLGGGDVMTMHDYRKAPQACADGACLRYIKTCTDLAGGAMRCDYRITWAGLIADGGITITADSRAALATAEGEIQKAVYRGETTTFVPLSLLTVTLPESSLKDCPGEASTCNPP
jgi:hypothetical protein